MKIEWKHCFRIGVSFFLLFLCIHYWEALTALLRLMGSAAEPLILGCVIAYLINILMSFYERGFFPKNNSKLISKSRRPVCMVLAILTMLGFIALFIGLALPELISCVKFIINEIPDVIRRISENEKIMALVPDSIMDDIAKFDWQQYASKIVNILTSTLSDAAEIVTSLLSSVISIVVTVFLGLIFSVYLLSGRDKLKRQSMRVVKAYVPERVRGKLLYVLEIFNDCFHKYIVGQCIEAVILGSLCAVGMLIFGFPYAMMIGVLIGFTALIPIAGAYIGAGLGAFMILTVSPIKSLLFIVFIVILQQLEGNLIYPRVVGSSIGLPGIWVLAAVTVGGGIYGIPGMLFGVPLAASIYRIIREDVRKRELATVPAAAEPEPETEAENDDPTEDDGQ